MKRRLHMCRLSFTDYSWSHNLPRAEQREPSPHCSASNRERILRTLPILAIATDYDDTLATNGRADEHALAALREWQSAGGRLLLVTGRELQDLLDVFPDIDLFDLVVAENGAVMYSPSTEEETCLASPPPPELI